jgi:hypothetical protein
MTGLKKTIFPGAVQADTDTDAGTDNYTDYFEDDGKIIFTGL